MGKLGMLVEVVQAAKGCMVLLIWLRWLCLLR